MSTRKNQVFWISPTHRASESSVVQNVNVWPFYFLAFELFWLLHKQPKSAIFKPFFFVLKVSSIDLTLNNICWKFNVDIFERKKIEDWSSFGRTRSRAR